MNNRLKIYIYIYDFLKDDIYFIDIYVYKLIIEICLNFIIVF